MDKDKAVLIVGVAIFSFAVGVFVDEVITNQYIKTHMSKEATVYLAAMDYVRAIRNGEE